MAIRRIKAKWAAKLLRARYFVLLTDTESAICLSAVDPNSIDDTLSLVAQTASIHSFIEKLQEFEKEHNRALQRLTKRTHAKKSVPHRRTTQPRKPARKIDVKQG